MVILREKRYSKLKIEPKKIIEATKKNIKDNPLALSISTASLAVSAGNLAVRNKQARQNKEFQKEQVEATNRLTEAIEGNKQAQEVLKKKKGTIKRSQNPKIFEEGSVSDSISKKYKIKRKS